MQIKDRDLFLRKGFTRIAAKPAMVSIFMILMILYAHQARAQESPYTAVKAAFHIHSSYSNNPYDKCVYTPKQIVDMYHAAGYDVIGLTDYNSISGSWAGIAEAQAEAAYLGMIVIPGEEVINEFPSQNGQVVWKHVIALFINSSISNNYSEHYTNDVSGIFGEIHAKGGIGVIAHSWQLNGNVVCGTSASPWWQFRNASYVDGWEIENWGPGMTNDEIATVIGSGKIYVASHDFQSGSVPTQKYNILYVSNFTLEGIKNALINQRNIVYYNGKVYGSPSALQLYQQNGTSNNSANITIISPLNSTYYNSSVPLIFTVSKPASWIGYSLDGHSNITITGNISLTNLTYGSHRVTVYANYTSSNADSASVSFRVSDVKPPTYANSFVNSTAAGRPVLFGLNWSDNAGLSGYVFQFSNGTCVPQPSKTLWIDNYSSWRYSDINAYPGSGWQNLGFNDSAWSTGQARLGNGTTEYAYVNTKLRPSNNIAYSTYYFRKNFTVDDTTKIINVTINIDYDDGYAIWLNGKEVNRSSNCVGVNFTNHSMLCSSKHDWMCDNEAYPKCTGNGSAYNKPVFPAINFNASGFVNGTNVIAVAIKQSSSTSTDSMMMFQMQGYVNGSCVEAWQNDTWLSFGSSTWSNVTKTVNSAIGANISWCYYANDSFGNWNGTSCSTPFSFTTTPSVDVTPPVFSLNSTNSTLAGAPVQHNLRWVDDVAMSGYIFSFDNCAGSLINDTWVPTTNWSNVTKTINSTIGCTIRWCAYANDTSNNWNSSCSSPWYYLTTSPIKSLLVSWTAGSPMNACTSGNPCQLVKNQTFVASATVNCSTSPAGFDCGGVYGSILYNGLTLDTQEAIPFYIVSGSNNQSCGLLIHGQSCQLNWTINTTGPINSRWNISSNFSSSIVQNKTGDATVRIASGAFPQWSLNQSSIQNTYDGTTISEFNITWSEATSVSIELNDTGIPYNCTATNSYGGDIWNCTKVIGANSGNPQYWKSYGTNVFGTNSSDEWNFTSNSSTENSTIYVSKDVPVPIYDYKTRYAYIPNVSISIANPVANISIVHTYVGDLKVTVGVGSTSAPLWSKVIWNRQGGRGSGYLNLTANLSDAIAYLSSSRNYTWFLSVYDGATKDTGKITSFTIKA